MASMHITNDATVQGSGPSVFRISNVLYRRIGAILPPQGCTNTKFVQTYFLSPEEQRSHRSLRCGTNRQAQQDVPLSELQMKYDILSYCDMFWLRFVKILIYIPFMLWRST